MLIGTLPAFEPDGPLVVGGDMAIGALRARDVTRMVEFLTALIQVTTDETCAFVFEFVV